MKKIILPEAVTKTIQTYRRPVVVSIAYNDSEVFYSIDGMQIYKEEKKNENKQSDRCISRR